MFKCYLRPFLLSALSLYGASQQTLNTHTASIQPVINPQDKIIFRYQIADCAGCWLLFWKCVSKLSSSISVATDSISIPFLQLHLSASSAFKGSAQLLLLVKPGLSHKCLSFAEQVTVTLQLRLFKDGPWSKTIRHISQ